MTDNVRKKIPYCPLLSAGCDSLKVCLQESCAWYTPATKSCVAFVVGHNNVLEIKQKQGK